jgi:F-type H+-transporting ATPase subunit b
LEALGINLPGLVAQIVNFSLLLAFLTFLMYKPITKMLDERATRIRESMERAEQVRQEAERAEKEFQARIEEARKEGQAILAQANQVGERIIAEAREEARREAESILTRARSEIAMERDHAIAELRSNFADLTILAASKVIKQSLDKQAHERLIHEVLEESRRLQAN